MTMGITEILFLIAVIALFACIAVKIFRLIIRFVMREVDREINRKQRK